MNGEEYWVDNLEEAERLSRKWKPKKKQKKGSIHR
jgi:hypothetical protein